MQTRAGRVAGVWRALPGRVAGVGAWTSTDDDA